MFLLEPRPVLSTPIIESDDPMLTSGAMALSHSHQPPTPQALSPITASMESENFVFERNGLAGGGLSAHLHGVITSHPHSIYALHRFDNYARLIRARVRLAHHRIVSRRKLPSNALHRADLDQIKVWEYSKTIALVPSCSYISEGFMDPDSSQPSRSSLHGFAEQAAYDLSSCMLGDDNCQSQVPSSMLDASQDSCSGGIPWKSIGLNSARLGSPMTVRPPMTARDRAIVRSPTSVVAGSKRCSRTGSVASLMLRRTVSSGGLGSHVLPNSMSPSAVGGVENRRMIGIKRNADDSQALLRHGHDRAAPSDANSQVAPSHQPSSQITTTPRADRIASILITASSQHIRSDSFGVLAGSKENMDTPATEAAKAMIELGAPPSWPLGGVCR